MTNRELKNIIQKIQTKEGIDLSEIAQRVNINRSYLSSFINNKTSKTVTAVYIGKFTKHFPGYFSDYSQEQQKPTDLNKIDQIIASLNDIQEYAITLITGQTAGHEVIMGALDRLEKKPEGSLSEAADRLALKLVERLNAIQMGKKADKRTMRRFDKDS